MPLFPLRGEHHQALSEGLGTRTGAPLLLLTTCTTIACSLENHRRKNVGKGKSLETGPRKRHLFSNLWRTDQKKKKKIKDVC